MNKNNIIDKITECAESNGWAVSFNTEQEKNITIFEFSKYTPAGQDFSFSATMKDNSLDTLATDMEEYYENFDVDSEAYLWLDDTGHGKNGAPYRMRDVLADMEAAEKNIENLLDAIREIDEV
ncbi:hypothetical protein INE92_01589 [Bacteroides xylanisolvens]|jgi:hypothetical protein|uniref:Uncharacterized protein n=2 Tax=Bacteroides eggerthii TaxID=28111 RepID=A0A975KIT8_9BACE|nr:hypothetical protein [Bacteroides xylanisolvens]QUT29582.1 hypothetical protein INE92_01589 [Bacteroides xylanisolvens]QUT46754.1 hypothetical protein INE88_03589 [Bacteroides eggerthii]